MQVKRAHRVASLLKETLSEALSRDIRDPRVGFVTITRVEMSDDLKYARVFYSVMGGDQEKKDTEEGMLHARGFLQKKVANVLKMRFTPHLQFVLDDSAEEAQQIEKIIRKIHNEGA